MKKFKFTWGHGLAIALGCFMIFITTLVILGSDTGDLVTEDYYQHSLNYQEETINASHRTSQLKEKPLIENKANGIRILFPEETKIDSGNVWLIRGANVGDDLLYKLKLRNHMFLIPAHYLVDGEYDMQLVWYVGEDKYLMKKTVVWKQPS